MKSNPLVINGRTHPLWQQFVDRQNEWIGGVLNDLDMGQSASTKITGIELKANGKDSAWFEVKGEDFECGGDTQYLGVTAGESGWLTFMGYGGHTWRIKTP